MDEISTRLNRKIYDCPLEHTKLGLHSDKVSTCFCKRNKEKIAL